MTDKVGRIEFGQNWPITVPDQKPDDDGWREADVRQEWRFGDAANVAIECGCGQCFKFHIGMGDQQCPGCSRTYRLRYSVEVKG